MSGHGPPKKTPKNGRKLLHSPRGESGKSSDDETPLMLTVRDVDRMLRRPEKHPTPGASWKVGRGSASLMKDKAQDSNVLLSSKTGLQPMSNTSRWATDCVPPYKATTTSDNDGTQLSTIQVEKSDVDLHHTGSNISSGCDTIEIRAFPPKRPSSFHNTKNDGSKQLPTITPDDEQAKLGPDKAATVASDNERIVFPALQVERSVSPPIRRKNGVINLLQLQHHPRIDSHRRHLNSPIDPHALLAKHSRQLCTNGIKKTHEPADEWAKSGPDKVATATPDIEHLVFPALQVKTSVSPPIRRKNGVINLLQLQHHPRIDSHRRRLNSPIDPRTLLAKHSSQLCTNGIKKPHEPVDEQAKSGPDKAATATSDNERLVFPALQVETSASLPIKRKNRIITERNDSINLPPLEHCPRIDSHRCRLNSPINPRTLLAKHSSQLCTNGIKKKHEVDDEWAKLRPAKVDTTTSDNEVLKSPAIQVETSASMPIWKNNGYITKRQVSMNLPPPELCPRIDSLRRRLNSPIDPRALLARHSSQLCTNGIKETPEPDDEWAKSRPAKVDATTSDNEVLKSPAIQVETSASMPIWKNNDHITKRRVSMNLPPLEPRPCIDSLRRRLNSPFDARTLLANAPLEIDDKQVKLGKQGNLLAPIIGPEHDGWTRAGPSPMNDVKNNTSLGDLKELCKHNSQLSPVVNDDDWSSGCIQSPIQGPIENSIQAPIQSPIQAPIQRSKIGRRLPPLNVDCVIPDDGLAWKLGIFDNDPLLVRKMTPHDGQNLGTLRKDGRKSAGRRRGSGSKDVADGSPPPAASTHHY